MTIGVRTRLMLHAVFVTGIALIIAGGAAIYVGQRAARQQLARDLTIRADTLAWSLQAVLMFESLPKEETQEILDPLEADANVAYVWVYDNEDNIFGRYRRDSLPAGRPPPPQVGETFADGRLIVGRSIVGEDERLGTIVMAYELDELQRSLRFQIGIGGGVLIGALGIASLLAYRLQRGISSPLQHLGDTARRIADYRDYSVRAVKTNDDEIGDLTDAFNVMLTEIETRDDELRRNRDELEHHVQERTSDLELARQAAVKASSAKSEFVANMSHEIRTPMTAILGYADVLLAPELDASTRAEAIQAIRRNGEHLLGVVNDILDMSKIEAGQMTVERVACSPAGVVTEAVSLMRGRAKTKGLEMSVTFDGPTPDTIQTDPTRLRQILINFLSNAIKFTETGSIGVTTRLVRDDGPPAFRVDVQDTGIGLTKEQLRNLFTPFTQADTSTTRRFGGTGLGLTISRRLVTMLGGVIETRSEPGKGSVFSLTVDTGSLDGVSMLEGLTEAELVQQAVTAGEERKDETTPQQLAGLRILLAEDGPDNQLLISYLLRQAGASVEIAENGRVACDKALEAWRESKAFDVILMDMQMPELDGYGAASRLRSEGYRGSIIALTAHALTEDREKCISAGCDDYMSKPIDRARLLSAIARLS